LPKIWTQVKGREDLDEHFEQRVPIVRRGNYAYYETLNFADRRRAFGEIPRA